MKIHPAVTMYMGTNTSAFDSSRGYGETESPSSCKAEKIPEGFLSDIAKLALKMIDLYISRFTEKKRRTVRIHKGFFE